MKIEVFHQLVDNPNYQMLFEQERVRLILEGLASIDTITTKYITDSNKFNAYPMVVEYLNDHDLDSLPLTIIDDKIVKTHSFLTNEEFMAYSGVSFVIEEDNTHHSSCCGGGCCGH